jgi:hypothetical protein
MILGASDFSRIKTNTQPKLGQPGEPVGELTTLGWTIMAAGEEADLSSVYFTNSSAANYEHLCSLDVLDSKINLTKSNNRCTKTSSNNYDAARKAGTKQGYYGNLDMTSLYQPTNPTVWDG